ncbi:N-6 DNA methylase [Schleiferiaceae bacterium]|nr:N-6 DNA methylase [Schleiferiaceae bacterium]
MSTYQEISSFIWKVCDDELRGLFKPHEYGDVILPFVVLRRLDCLLEPHKDEVVQLYNDLKDTIDDVSPIIRKKTGLTFYNYSAFDLQRLKSDPNKIGPNFSYYRGCYSDNVIQILENFQIEKLSDKLAKNKKLYSLIDKFTEVDLHPDKVDNHTMGSIFEELLRRFSEMSNETSGEHYTPRDVVNLLVSLVFSGDKNHLEGEGILRSIFDPCCGTGGMLTIGKDWVQENISDDVKFQLYGQELNPQTFSICKSDFLITGEDPDNIKLGSSLSFDQFQGKKFDYMITNPPFGVSWKSEKDYILAEKEDPYGRFSIGTPKISDGSLLFLQHLISKMKDTGSRIGVVFNGSPLFSGDAGSGESEIRRWILENDWLECVVALPDQMFFNTAISTYIWIVTNKKSPYRKGKVQLIDGSSFFNPMKKSLGDKRKYMSDDHLEKVLATYQSNEENEYSKIFSNEYFGYTKVTIESPLIENGYIKMDAKGNPKADKSLKDFEIVPLTDSIEDFFNSKVKPFSEHSWMNRQKDKIGYEINFSRYFYKFQTARSPIQISDELNSLESRILELTKELASCKIELNRLFKNRDRSTEAPNEWIQDTPKNWSLVKVKHITKRKSINVGVEDFKKEQVIHYSIPNVQKYGTGVKENGADIDSTKLLLEGGELIISKLNPRKSCVTIVQEHPNELVLGSGEFIALEPQGCELKYLYHFFKSQPFTDYLNSCVESVTRSHQRVNPAIILNCYVPLPPLKIQKEIVSALDKFLGITNDIHQAIHKKSSLINELNQEFTSQLTNVGFTE